MKELNNNAASSSDHRKIESITAMLEILLARQERFLQDERKVEFTWYRGHADMQWELLPAVLRRWFRERVELTSDYQPENHLRLLEKEKALYADFRRRGISLLSDKAINDDVALYFLAQHHGMPTRLLDWTQNPLTALFFAVVNPLETDGMLYVLDPSWPLNKEGITDWSKEHRSQHYLNALFGPYHSSKQLVIDVIKAIFVGANFSQSLNAIPIQPDLYAGRILQQASCFTLHGPTGLASIPSPFVESYVIPKEYKVRIQLELRQLNINWATLFPDLDNLAREMRTEKGWNL